MLMVKCVLEGFASLGRSLSPLSQQHHIVTSMGLQQGGLPLMSLELGQLISATLLVALNMPKYGKEDS